MFDVTAAAHQVNRDFVALVFRHEVGKSGNPPLRRVDCCNGGIANVLVIEPAQGEALFRAVHHRQPFIADGAQFRQQFVGDRRFVQAEGVTGVFSAG